MPSTLACLMEWESACGTGGFRAKRQMCLGGADRQRPGFGFAPATNAPRRSMTIDSSTVGAYFLARRDDASDDPKTRAARTQ